MCIVTEIHIALVAPKARQGGIARYSERFTAVLKQKGAMVTPVVIENTKTSNPLAFVDVLRGIPDEADVIHVQFEAGLFGKFGMSGIGAPAFFIALMQMDTPVVATLHEVHSEHVHRGAVGDRLLQSRDALIERLALRAADATVVHTTEARRVLYDRHGENHRIERMLHPVDANANPIPDEAAMSELGVDGPVVLTFGFVEEKKRYEDMIRALPAFPNLTYLIGGGFREGEGETVWKRCESLAGDLGVSDRVRHLGYVADDEMPIVFSAADIVVLPYERVSQSGVVNDALAYRRPSVASSLPAFEELRAEYDCLLTYEDQSGLQDAIAAVLQEESTRERLQECADEYVAAMSWERFGEWTVQLYRDL
jgi:glycosyltransferase involved in cell wall biosynthesis